MAWSLKKIAIVTGVTVGGGALAFVTGGAAAPLVGTIIGSSAGMGLSGAAATSAGLAALGGGSLVAGGAGIAGGTALVSSAAAAVGAAGSAIGSAVVASSVEEAKKCSNCDVAVNADDKFCTNCGQKIES